MSDNSEIYAVLKASGSFLPPKLMTNKDLETLVETNDEWITSRTGIKQRYIAGNDMNTSDMATLAAQSALAKSGLDPKSIDQVIVATTTPDCFFPSVAAKLQKNLSLTNAAAYDIQAVCAGFVFGLSIANAMIKSGQAKNILLIGAEKMSSILDWTDRGTCVLFGDGAGAVVLSAEQSLEPRGILGTKLASDGSFGDILYTEGGLSDGNKPGLIRMKGKEVFKHAVEKMTSISLELLKNLGIEKSEIDFMIPHQANIRILESVADKLGMPPEKLIITVGEHANTSAASIPLALDNAISSGKVMKNDLLLFSAIGGGLCWGSALVRL